MDCCKKCPWIIRCMNPFPVSSLPSPHLSISSLSRNRPSRPLSLAKTPRLPPHSISFTRHPTLSTQSNTHLALRRQRLHKRIPLRSKRLQQRNLDPKHNRLHGRRSSLSDGLRPHGRHQDAYPE